MKKHTMFLCALVLVLGSSLTASATVHVWTPVTDVDKYWGVGQPAGTANDNNACWLATASNVLNYTGWNGAGHANEQAIYDWFLINVYTGAGGGGAAAYSAYFSQFHPTENYLNYFHQWNTNATILTGIDNYLNSNYGLYLSITQPGATMGHAITAWGYETDALGAYTHVYVTDSDDGVGGAGLEPFSVHPAHPDLNRVPVSLQADGNWHMMGYYGHNNWYMRRIDALGPVPEPSTLLLLGIVLTAVVGLGRKKLLK